MNKSFLAGFALAVILLLGCASVQYRFYGLQLPPSCYEQGTLLGMKDSYPDVPFIQCAPDNTVRGKCVIQLTEDFFSKDRDLQQCQSDLKRCQNPN